MQSSWFGLALWIFDAELGLGQIPAGRHWNSQRRSTVLPQLEIEIPFMSSQISLDFDEIPWIRILSPICFA